MAGTPDIAPDLLNGFVICGPESVNSFRTNIECVLERRKTGADRQFSYLSNECRAELVADTIFDGRIYEACILTTWDGIFSLRHGSYNYGFNPAKNTGNKLPEKSYMESGQTDSAVHCNERRIKVLSFEEALAHVASGPNNDIFMKVDWEMAGVAYSLYSPCRYTNYPNSDLTDERYLQPISGYVMIELDDRFYLAYVAAHVTEDGTKTVEFICRDKISFIQTKPKTGRLFWLFNLLDRMLLKRIFVTDEFHKVVRVEGDCRFFTYHNE